MRGQQAFQAEEYDREIRRVLPYYDDFYQQILDVVRARFHSPVSWLDVGCGTGRMGQCALAGAEVERFVFCDPSEEMLDIARQRFGGRGEFIQAAAQEIEYAGQFDVVTAVQVFHYLSLEQRIEAIRRCHRALRPEGIFITFENFAPSTPQLTELYLERWRAYQLANGRTPAQCDAHIRRYGKSYYPIPISAHLEALRQGGFHSAEVLWVSNMQVGLLGMR